MGMFMFFFLVLSYLFCISAFGGNFYYPGILNVYREGTYVAFPLQCNGRPKVFVYYPESKKYLSGYKLIKLLARNQFYFYYRPILNGYYEVSCKGKTANFSVISSLKTKCLGVSDWWHLGKTLSFPLNEHVVKLLASLGAGRVRIFLEPEGVKRYGWQHYQDILLLLKSSNLEPILCIRYSSGYTYLEFKNFVKEALSRLKFVEFFEIGNEVDIKKSWPFSLKDYVSLIEEVVSSYPDKKILVGVTASINTKWWKNFFTYLSPTAKKRLYGLSVHIYRKTRVDEAVLGLPRYWGRRSLFDDWMDFHENVVSAFSLYNKAIYVTEFGENTTAVRGYNLVTVTPLQQAEDFFKAALLSNAFNVETFMNYMLIDTPGLGMGLFFGKGKGFYPKPIINSFGFLSKILSSGRLSLIFSSKYFLFFNKKYVIFYPRVPIEFHDSYLGGLVDMKEVYVYNFLGEKIEIHKGDVVKYPIIFERLAK